MSSFNYTKRRKSGLQQVWRVGLILIGIIVVWLVIRFFVQKNADSIPVLYPSTVYNTLTPKRTLVKKINELQTTLESAEAARATAAALQSENDALKTELNRTPRPTGTLANVITLPNRSFYDTFTIDAGEDQHVHVDQTAYAFGTIALGTISAVSSDHATVTLFSAANRTTSGSAVGSDVAVTLIGRGGGEYEVRMPRDVHFEVGGVITMQSAETAVLASIERIVTDPRDPFQRLIAKAPVNLQALKWVIVR